MIALLAILVILLVLLIVFGYSIGVLISVAIVGAIIGGLARLVIPGRQDIGIFATIVVGWIGSLVGGFLGHRVLHINNFLTVLLEIGVAVVLVLLATTAGNSWARRDRSLRY